MGNEKGCRFAEVEIRSIGVMGKRKKEVDRIRREEIKKGIILPFATERSGRICVGVGSGKDRING